MTLTATQLSILEKVRKLLAKANSTDSEDESMVAINLAHDLLTKHGLDMSQVPEQERTDGIIHENFFVPYAGDVWRKQVAIALGSTNMVKVMFTKILVPVKSKKYGITIDDWRPGYVLVGRPINVEITKSMIEYLFKTVVRMGNKHYSDQRLRHQYERGAGLRLRSRLDRMYWEMITPKEEQVEKSGLPALVNNEMTVIGEFIKKQFPKVRNVDLGAIKAYGDAARKGFDEANDISLSKQIGGKTNASSKFLLGSS